MATFDTRIKKGRWFPTGSAASAAAKRLKKLGYQVVVEPEQFAVVESEGPLEEGELERAEQWGTQLADQAAEMLAGAEPALAI